MQGLESSHATIDSLRKLRKERLDKADRQKSLSWTITSCALGLCVLLFFASSNSSKDKSKRCDKSKRSAFPWDLPARAKRAMEGLHELCSTSLQGAFEGRDLASAAAGLSVGQVHAVESRTAQDAPKQERGAALKSRRKKEKEGKPKEAKEVRSKEAAAPTASKEAAAPTAPDTEPKPKDGKKAAKGGKKLPPVEAKQPLTQTEDILNSILPPRCARGPHRLLRLPGSCRTPATAYRARRDTLWRPPLAL